MEKSTYDREINRLIAETQKLTEKSQLDLDTSNFLDNEALKLEEIIENPNSTREQIEESVIKLEALYNRIEREMAATITHDLKMNQIEKELNILRKQRR